MTEQEIALIVFSKHGAEKSAQLAEAHFPVPAILSMAHEELGEEKFVEILAGQRRRAWISASLIHFGEKFEQSSRDAFMYALRSRTESSPPKVLLALALFMIVLFFPTAIVTPFFDVTTLWYFKDNVSVLQGLKDLYKHSEYFLFTVILVFTILFPLSKLMAIAAIIPYFGTWKLADRKHVEWSNALGKWSMLDVFVVTVLVVLIKAKTIADIRLGVGIYLFTGCVFATQGISWWITHEAKKAGARERSRLFWIDHTLDYATLTATERKNLESSKHT